MPEYLIMHDLIRRWDGAWVATHHDRATRATIHVAVHTPGPEAASGGTRMKPYAEPAEALRDALRLSEGMSLKFAVLDLPRGGGKAVIDVPPGLAGAERDGLLERFGDLLESLRGAFATGPDMGTSPNDMDRIASRTRHVFGRTPENGGAGDPGPTTALGVFAGIEACVRFRFGLRSVTGRSVLVQGVGDVGRPLVRLLREAGAVVLASDVNIALRPALEAEGCRWVDPVEAMVTPCDVFAPCATGGILNAETTPRLQAPIVAGSANNQLATHEDAARLQARGVLYAPDFAINGGGALLLIGGEMLGWSAAEIDRRTRGLGERLLEILRAAEADGLTTAEAAIAVARRRLGTTMRIGEV
jgi:leucine dehydrogenase